VTLDNPIPENQKIRDEQIERYLKICQGYLMKHNMRLRLKKWKDINGIHYQLVDEDPETLEWHETSRAMTKSEMFENLFCLAQLFNRIDRIHWARYLNAEQDREHQLWERYSGGDEDEQ
jgi:hypothetical protein